MSTNNNLFDPHIEIIKSKFSTEIIDNHNYFKNGRLFKNKYNKYIFLEFPLGKIDSNTQYFFHIFKSNHQDIDKIVIDYFDYSILFSLNIFLMDLEKFKIILEAL